MGKEYKIGLAVIGVLLLVFGTLLFRRLVGIPWTANTPPEQSTADTAGDSHDLLAPTAEEPSTVLLACRQRPAYADDGPTSPAWGGATGQRESEISAATERAYRNDYSREAEPDAAAAPRSNPFQRRSLTAAEDPSARDDQTTSGEPRPLQRIPVAPLVPDEGPPSGVRRNPLRQMSADMPWEAPADLEAAARPDEPEAAIEPIVSDPLPLPARRRWESSDESSPWRASEPIAANDARQTSDSRWSDEPREQPAERPPARVTRPPNPGERTAVETGKYTVQPNDSLWTISEKVYGTGGYFKALGEHNRFQMPQPDRLTVGTQVATPPISVLEQKYPTLVPKQRRSALVEPQAVQASATARMPRGSNVYVVEQGDTLFDIARYELGKASRWSEIYELNREALGQDFDYLQPGTRLAMPPRDSADSLTRQPETGVRR